MGIATFIGLVLWSLIPGFIASSKGRSFFIWFALSFLISPLLTTIIVALLPKVKEEEELEYDPNRIMECASCGYRGEYPAACPKCGKYARRYVYLNSDVQSAPAEQTLPVPAEVIPKKQVPEAVNAIPITDQRHFCVHCGAPLLPDGFYCGHCGMKIR